MAIDASHGVQDTARESGSSRSAEAPDSARQDSARQGSASPDDETAAASACLAKHPHHEAVESRTRLWINGKLEKEGFPISDISEVIAQDGAMVWLDFHQPDSDDLSVISEEFGLHPLAIEDATTTHQRPKLDRYSDHLFLNMYFIHAEDESGALQTSELSAFVLPKALITIRKAGGLSVEKMLARWDGAPQLLTHGPGALVHGLIDLVVDGHFTAVQSMDDLIEDLEEQIFSDEPLSRDDQRNSFNLRKSLALLRRVILPMREVVNGLMRRELGAVDDELTPYYQDVYDHVLRVTEWTESLRDLVTTIRETNLTLQGNRLNEIMKKLTSWAAIIAVPTAVTGFFGQNVPYPGFNKTSGFYASVLIMAIIALALYLGFRKRDWL